MNETADNDNPVPEPEQDQLLSNSLNSEDSLVIDRLMEIYRPLLVNAASQFIPVGLQGRIDRSDLVQETLIRGFTQKDRFRGTTSNEFVVWLRQILQNIAIDAIRHHTTAKRDARRSTESVEILVSQEDSPSQNLGQQEEFERIAIAMSQLTPDQRQVVELRSKGMAFKEIGEQTGRTEDATRRIWGRGVAKLMQILRVHDQHE
ncbi:sigma-70 family RNA polymerase sigma factor [Planctomicrobium sp. SH527]|uniref:sigma-70 family RNA polymerase sigma factor n=1 Tax=Planctomicrobium sp. SH527 TaxID=3448123 RepID=UPI003F5B2462